MGLLLPSILANAQRPHSNYVLVQSSIAQTCLPVLRRLVNHRPGSKRARTILICFLYPPSSLCEGTGDAIDILDYTGNVPGYAGTFNDPRDAILEAAKAAPAAPLNIIIDSVDTLASDLGSTSQTYQFLHALITLIRARPNPSTLILHVLAPSQLIPLLSATSFSPSLTHILAHPPVLLTHLATAYLTPPPPLSTPEKFWGVFIPFSERAYESEKLVFGPNGEGSGGIVKGELVVEVLVRGGGEGRRRTVERVLEGWADTKGGPCELNAMESLKSIWTKKAVAEEAPPDPTQNVSFNLNLTDSQQQSRAQVPLPYAHEGKPLDNQAAPAAILYDPDSADDIDDDDPDEDLDI
ncbi:hypothetical protein FIBSPDRAFT_1037730 [Athelia psychrophila]|uniref:Elongator complex protein 5 n=1 Tax=Athelia psychrophila TaxID=1759441 RepID=A0A166U3K3_9AGAM|nr:hypothetical protein FIBSPDRAFT_1037730 [Fibularhizoctonia sp. CBS 109695]